MGGRREKGPTKRKLPVTREDIGHVYNMLDRPNPDSVTLRCAISAEWFFMLRMGVYLDLGPKRSADKELRHPLMMCEIEPPLGGRRAERSGGANEISIYIYPDRKPIG